MTTCAHSARARENQSSHPGASVPASVPPLSSPPIMSSATPTKDQQTASAAGKSPTPAKKANGAADTTTPASPDAAKVKSPRAKKSPKPASVSAGGAVTSPTPAAAASASPVDNAATGKRERKPRTPLSAEEQAARDAANKLRPCFDLAEKKACEKGDACKFSHDPAVLATASEARKADEARKVKRDAEAEKRKAERAAERAAEREASRPEREAKAAAAKAERDAKQEAAKVEKAKKAAEKPAAAAPAVKANGAPAVAAAAASSPNDTKQPRGKKPKEAKNAAAAASSTAPTASAVPAVLATGVTAPATNAIDLSHIIVRNAITARHTGQKASERAKLSARLMKKPFVIGMTGGTASGKTTVCNEFCERIGAHRVAVLQMDRFYFSLPHGKPAEQHNFDDPSAFDWDYFNTTLEKLSTGATVQVPQYSFETHQRLEKLDTFYPAEVILVEGILTLHDERIRKQFDLKVFIEADSDVRLARRIQRDIEERARTVDGVIHQYITTVKPSHDKYIQPSARYADIIVPHNGPKNGIAIDLLAQHVSTEIYKRGANLSTKPTKAQREALKGKKDGGQVLATSSSPSVPAAAPVAHPSASPTKPTRGPQMAARTAARTAQ